MGSRRDVANRRQHRSGCASIPSSDCGPRSHQSSAVSLELTYTESERLFQRPLLQASHRNMSVTLSLRAECRLFLSHRSRLQSIPSVLSFSLNLSLSLAPSDIRIFPLDRRVLRLSSSPARVLFANATVSFSIAPDCVYVSLMHLPPFFSLNLSLSLCLSPCPWLLVSVVLTGREIRSNTRDDVTSTPCAVCRRGA